LAKIDFAASTWSKPADIVGARRDTDSDDIDGVLNSECVEP
jgi:hypothetical protein